MTMNMTRRFIIVVLVALVAGSLSSACSRDVERLKREYVERGDRYMTDKNVEAAIIEYRNAVQQDPRFADAYRKLLTAYVAQGNGPAAVRAAVSAADLLPDSDDAQVEAGGLLLLAGEFTEAKARAQRVLARNAKDIRARVLLGNATAGLKDIDTAIKEFEEAVRLDPGRSGLYAGLATLKASQGEQQAAERIFHQAIDVDPKSAAARLALAQFYWSSKRLDDAERAMKEAHGLAPNDARVNGMLAAFYQSTRRASEAEPYLRTAVEKSKDPRLTMVLADYYLSANRLPDAQKLLEPLTSDKRLGSLASMRLAAMAQLQDRPDEALAIIDHALSLDPKSAPTLAAKSDLLRRQNKLDEAVKAADAAVAANAASPEAQFARGRVLQQKGSLEGAERAFNEVLRLNPQAAAARVELARLRLREGADDAVAVATEAAKADPNRLDARLTLARAQMQRREFAQAQIVLDEALRAAPNVGAVHAQMGTLLAMKRDTAGARSAFTRALELDATQVEALTGLTGLDFEAGRRQEALARLDAAVEQAPKNPGLLLIAGRAHAAAHDFPRAEGLLSTAITIDVAAMDAYSLLGRVYLAQKKLDAARVQFTKQAERQERPIGALTVVGIIDMLQDRTSDAQQTFERVLQLDPKAGVAANNLAWIYLENGGSLEVAQHLAEIAKTALPNAPEVNDTLGWAYFKNGAHAQAIAAFRRTLELDPKNPTAVYHLALAYEQVGDRREARDALTRYLALDPSSQRSAEVKKRLQALGI
jgi:tetratricopeptide (TPR) repeat protein